MRMGVFRGRLGLERIGPRMLGCSKRRIEVSSDIKMASALLAGWQRPAYTTFDLPLDIADWGSSLERQRWVPLQRLSSLLMGQLAWEECRLRTCPGKQKTAFQTLYADSLATLTYGTTTTRASGPGPEIFILRWNDDYDVASQAVRILACSSAVCPHWRGLPRHMLPISWASSCKCFINYYPPPTPGLGAHKER